MQISEIVPGVFHFRFDKRVEIDGSCPICNPYNYDLPDPQPESGGN